MVCAFQLEPVEVLPDSFPEHAAHTGPLWLHLNLVDGRVRRWLADSDLPSPAKELLLEDDPQIRADDCEPGFGFVLGDLHHDFDDDPDGFGVLRVYVDQRRIITARLRPIKSVELLHRRLRMQPEPGTTLDLLHSLLQCYEEVVAEVISRFADAVDDAEDEILAGHLAGKGSSLGRRRRLLARLRRQVHANRAAVGQMLAARPDAWSSEDVEPSRACRERMQALAQDIELVSDRARLLQEEIAARQNEATNRNLYLLSTLTTALLPITLVTGIFGMNLTDLPFANSRHGFAIVVVLMSLGVAVAMHLLRRRRLE